MANSKQKDLDLKPIKSSWNREEVIKLLELWDDIAEENGRNSIAGNSDNNINIYNWIKENL